VSSAARSSRWKGLGALLICVSAPAVGQTASDWSRPRELPSLSVAWRDDGPVCNAAVADGLVLVLSPQGLSARDARTGDRIWEQRAVVGECGFGGGVILMVSGAAIVAAQGGIFWVDLLSGDVTASIECSRVRNLWRQPLLAEVEVEDGADETLLLRIDEATGRELARTQLPKYISSLATIADNLVLVVPAPSERAYEVRALRTSDLTELWRRRGFAEVEIIDGNPYMQTLDREGYGSDWIRVDPRTGSLGESIPPREEDGIRMGRPDLVSTWALQLLEERQTHRVRLRRNRAPSGDAIWTADLAGRPNGIARLDSRLFVHCSGRGRGILVVLDWETGKLLQSAYGTHGSSLVASGEWLVLFADDELVVASADAFGPPEQSLHSVEEEVLRILSREPDSTAIGASGEELAVLGSEALPVLVRELPGLSSLWIQAAAPLLGEARYAPASAALLRVLSEHPVSSPDDRRARAAATEALGLLADPGATEVIGELATSVSEDVEVRRFAFQGLVEIGTLQAATTLADVVDSHRGVAFHWKFPDAERFLDLVGKPYDEAAADTAMENGDSAEWLRRNVAASAMDVPAGSGSLLVFPDWTLLGSPMDFWAVERDDSGRVEGVPFYLGKIEAARGCYFDCRFTAKVEGDLLSIERSDGTASHSVVSLLEARKDTDEDLLTDWFEQRVSIDPARRDTDGDGTPDGEDSQPDASPRPAADEEAELVESVFEQLCLLREGSDEGSLKIVEADVVHRWRRLGPTLTAPSGQELKERLDSEFLSVYRLEPVTNGFARQRWGRALHASEGDRLYRVVRSAGPLNSDSQVIVMHPLGKRWFVRQILPEWVS
jgi:hypothetical protein